MSKSPTPFANNWAYLKTELNWLERLLMLAVARKRKELKEIGRVAHNRGDKVTSHWWQGLISVTTRAYDEGPPQKKSADKSLGYQKQLDLRIRASLSQNIALALPQLRRQLNLSLFEKNALLMALAPEVNLRYSRLYHFLQTGEENNRGTLPTVDLMLQLLCRNEAERRLALAQLTGPQSLIQRQILQRITPDPHTLLGSYLQLAPDWASYLLADFPEARPHLALGTMAQPVPLKLKPVPAVSWDQLALPAEQVRSLRSVADQAQALLTSQTLSLMVLLVGESGTGKTAAAGAIAATLSQPIRSIELSQYPAEQRAALLHQLTPQKYPLLLVGSAQLWLGRKTTIDPAKLRQWWQQRAESPALTIFTTCYSYTVRAHWRQLFNSTLHFSPPDPQQRQQLWQQSFPNGIRAVRKHHWETLSEIPLTGSQIQQIAKTAQATADKPTLDQVQQALSLHGYTTPIKKTSKRLEQ
ncbi:MAG: hypothetical protein AAFR42_00710 [Cyanobacteria bacterium J06628_6]